MTITTNASVGIISEFSRKNRYSDRIIAALFKQDLEISNVQIVVD
jgi:hypothetical protein